MKQLSLLALTLLMSSFLVACSESKSHGGGGYIDPGIVPPTPVPVNDGFITWQSERWNNNITNPLRFSQLLTGGTAGSTQCWTSGYYPGVGHRHFFGNQNCENYTNAAYIMFRYNPDTNQAQIFVYGNCSSWLCGGNLIAGFSRESTASPNANGLFIDFGPLSSNGMTPDDFSEFKVYVSSTALTHVDTLPIAVKFGPAPSGQTAVTDNLKRIN